MQGKAPLVVEVMSADIMATVVALKKEVESKLGTSLRFTFLGATEAPLLAKELGAANIGVIFTPARPFPESWEERRM